MDKNTRRILEDLEPYGLGANKDISSALEEMYKWESSLTDIALQEHAKGMVRFINTMKDSGLIELHGDNYRRYGSGNTTDGFAWFGSNPIGASITFKGMEKLALLRAMETDNLLLQSSLLTNASIQQANQIAIENVEGQKIVSERQRKQTNAALWIAGLSAFIALMGVLKDLWKSDKVQLTIPQGIDSIYRNKEIKIECEKRTFQMNDSTVKDVKVDSAIKSGG